MQALSLFPFVSIPDSALGKSIWFDIFLTMSDASTKLYNDAIDAVQAGNLETAISLTEEALTEDPGDTLTWQLYVKLLAAAGRTEDATKATKKLKSLGLGETEALMIDAANQMAAGDIDAAIATFEAASEIDPKSAEPHSSRAMALSQKGDQQNALKAARAAVEIAPSDSRAYYALGHLLRINGEKEDALRFLTTSLADEPDFAPALYEQGMLLAENGQLEAALSNFEKFAAVHSDDPNVKKAIQSIKIELGKTDTY